MQTLDIEPGKEMVSGWGMGLGLPMAVDDGIRHWQQWGAWKGEATICTHLKTRRRAANEPQVVAIATNAKNGPSKLTTSAKGSPVMCTERETGEEKERERDREMEMEQGRL